jgi:hypothetical protein
MRFQQQAQVQTVPLVPLTTQQQATVVTTLLYSLTALRRKVN